MFFLQTNDGWISTIFIVRLRRREDGDFDVGYHDGESHCMALADAEDALKLIEQTTAHGADDGGPLC